MKLVFFPEPKHGCADHDMEAVPAVGIAMMSWLGHDWKREERSLRSSTHSSIGRRGEVILLCLSISLLLATSQGLAEETVSIPIPRTQQQIQADVYGGGKNDNAKRGIVLAHGGRFDKTSWRKQAQTLARTGFVVLAISFRGDRKNPDGSAGSFGSTPDNATDVLAAVKYLHKRGIKRVSAIGGSMGGDAVGEADARSAPGEIDSIVLLGSSGGDYPAKLTGRKLFIVAREDSSGDGPRLPEITRHYAKAPPPKRLIVLEGSAHAQYLFDTEQGPRLMEAILRFLSNP
jgi:pimeloyl-ACP methyl ester carboxylesterase